MSFTLAGHITWTRTEYGMVLLDEAKGAYWNLNPTGVTVLQVLLDSGDLDVAATALAQEHAVDMDTARADADELLSALRSAGLVLERD
ncbi:lasso peptide biosynthesis PqqD family chaperone [Streptomyces sp. NPDC001719]